MPPHCDHEGVSGFDVGNVLSDGLAATAREEEEEGLYFHHGCLFCLVIRKWPSWNRVFSQLD